MSSQVQFNLRLLIHISAIPDRSHEEFTRWRFRMNLYDVIHVEMYGF